jgi:hypothetical protein
MDPSLIAVAISALVYSIGMMLRSLPIRRVKEWGWSSIMHSITSVALISIIPALTVVRSIIAPHIEPYLGVDIDASPEEALRTVTSYEDMVYYWMSVINIAALGLAGAWAIINLALTLLLVTGPAAVLLKTVASYLFSAVFGIFIFVQKLLSSLYIFAEVVRVFTSLIPVLGPAMFTAGLILFATPFARRLGKTLIVFGAAITLALPPIIVSALPSPEKAEEEIRKTRDIQAYSIALDRVREVNAGVKINIFDRNGTVEHVKGGRSFHDSRMLKYPYFKLELKGGENAPQSIVDCSNIPPQLSCGEVVGAVVEMLKQSESGFVNSGQGKIEDGYRTTLTMPEPAGPEGRAGTYTPDAWILGLWMYIQGDTGKRDEPVRISGREIKVEPPGRFRIVCNDVTCWEEEKTSEDIYVEWKEKWEDFWSNAPYRKVYLENAVQEGNNTSLIWFTRRPVGSDQPLNVFVVYPGVQSLECRITETYREGNETKHKYGIFVKLSEVPVTYFVYLDGAEYSVDSDVPVEVREVNATELAGKVVRKAETLSLDPSIEVVGSSTPPRIEAFPPAHYMLVYFPGGEFQMGEGETCEEAYKQYLENMVKDLMLEDNSTNPYVDDYRRCFEEAVSSINQYLNSTNNESGNYTGPEVIVEPDEANSTSTPLTGPACVEGGGVMPYPVTIEFKLIKESPLAPWRPNVEWEAFDRDEEYVKALASGGVVDDSKLNMDFDTHREEWDDYPIFRLGLYRDGPVHYGQRLVVRKLMEYRSSSWSESEIATMVYRFFRDAAEEAKKSSPIGAVAIPVVEFLVSGDKGIGILEPMARLMGHAFALALCLIIFTITTDIISGIVGGESGTKLLVGKPVAMIAGLFHAGGMVWSAARSSMKWNIAGYIAKKQAEKEMYQSLLYEKSKRPEEHRKALERYIDERSKHGEFKFIGESMKKLGDKIGGRFGHALSRAGDTVSKLSRVEPTVRAKIGEALLDARMRLEGKGLYGALERPLLEALSKKHALDLHRYRLLTDPEYAGRYERHALYFKQMMPAKMTPRRFAEGFSYMIKNAPFWERVALIDQLDRNPSIGRNILLKGVAGKTAEAISWMTGGRVNIPVTTEITAPASFSIAADKCIFPQELSGGLRPDIPVAYPHLFSVGLITYGHEGVPAPPYIFSKHSESDKLEEISRAISYVDSYARPLSEDEKATLMKMLADIHLDMHRVGEPIEGPEYLSVKFAKNAIDGRMPIGPADFDSNVNLESIPYHAAKPEKYMLEPEDTQEFNLFRGEYEPTLPRDLSGAFPWTSDIMKVMELRGYTLADAFNVMENSSRDVLDMMGGDGSSSLGAWFSNIAGSGHASQARGDERWWESGGGASSSPTSRTEEKRMEEWWNG